MLCPHEPSSGAECTGHILVGLVGKPQASEKEEKLEEGCKPWLIVYLVSTAPTVFGTTRTLYTFY